MLNLLKNYDKTIVIDECIVELFYEKQIFIQFEFEKMDDVFIATQNKYREYSQTIDNISENQINYFFESKKLNLKDQMNYFIKIDHQQFLNPLQIYLYNEMDRNQYLLSFIQNLVEQLVNIIQILDSDLFFNYQIKYFPKIQILNMFIDNQNYIKNDINHLIHIIQLQRIKFKNQAQFQQHKYLEQKKSVIKQDQCRIRQNYLKQNYQSLKIENIVYFDMNIENIKHRKKEYVQTSKLPNDMIVNKNQSYKYDIIDLLDYKFNLLLDRNNQNLYLSLFECSVFKYKINKYHQYIQYLKKHHQRYIDFKKSIILQDKSILESFDKIKIKIELKPMVFKPLIKVKIEENQIEEKKKTKQDIIEEQQLKLINIRKFILKQTNSQRDYHSKIADLLNQNSIITFQLYNQQSQFVNGIQSQGNRFRKFDVDINDMQKLIKIQNTDLVYIISFNYFKYLDNKYPNQILLNNNFRYHTVNFDIQLKEVYGKYDHSQEQFILDYIKSIKCYKEKDYLSIEFNNFRKINDYDQAEKNINAIKESIKDTFDSDNDEYKELIDKIIQAKQILIMKQCQISNPIPLTLPKTIIKTYNWKSNVDFSKINVNLFKFMKTKEQEIIFDQKIESNRIKINNQEICKNKLYCLNYKHFNFKYSQLKQFPTNNSVQLATETISYQLLEIGILHNISNEYKSNAIKSFTLFLFDSKNIIYNELKDKRLISNIAQKLDAILFNKIIIIVLEKFNFNELECEINKLLQDFKLDHENNHPLTSKNKRLELISKINFLKNNHLKPLVLNIYSIIHQLDTQINENDLVISKDETKIDKSLELKYLRKNFNMRQSIYDIHSYSDEINIKISDQFSLYYPSKIFLIFALDSIYVQVCNGINNQNNLKKNILMKLENLRLFIEDVLINKNKILSCIKQTYENVNQTKIQVKKSFNSEKIIFLD